MHQPTLATLLFLVTIFLSSATAIPSQPGPAVAADGPILLPRQQLCPATCPAGSNVNGDCPYMCQLSTNSGPTDCACSTEFGGQECIVCDS